jgi:hypothetical protein
MTQLYSNYSNFEIFSNTFQKSYFLVFLPLSLRAAAIDHAKQGGLRIDIKHKYYVPLLANLLVIYIIRMKTRPRRAPYIVFFHFTHSKNGPDKLQLKLFLEP